MGAAECGMSMGFGLDEVLIGVDGKLIWLG